MTPERMQLYALGIVTGLVLVMVCERYRRWYEGRYGKPRPLRLSTDLLLAGNLLSGQVLTWAIQFHATRHRGLFDECENGACRSSQTDIERWSDAARGYRAAPSYRQALEEIRQHLNLGLPSEQTGTEWERCARVPIDRLHAIDDAIDGVLGPLLLTGEPKPPRYLERKR